jgi:hypothetical protein
LEQFGDRPFRVVEASAVGIPRYELYRLRDRGEIAASGQGPSAGLAARSARAPTSRQSVLTDELPAAPGWLRHGAARAGPLPAPPRRPARRLVALARELGGRRRIADALEVALS